MISNTVQQGILRSTVASEPAESLQETERPSLKKDYSIDLSFGNLPGLEKVPSEPERKGAIPVPVSSKPIFSPPVISVIPPTPAASQTATLTKAHKKGFTLLYQSLNQNLTLYSFYWLALAKQLPAVVRARTTLILDFVLDGPPSTEPRHWAELYMERTIPTTVAGVRYPILEREEKRNLTWGGHLCSALFLCGSGTTNFQAK